MSANAPTPIPSKEQQPLTCCGICSAQLCAHLRCRVCGICEQCEAADPSPAHLLPRDHTVSTTTIGRGCGPAKDGFGARVPNPIRDAQYMTTRKKIYVASSWRNPIQQEIVQVLREDGHEVYDFRNPSPGNHGFAWSEVNADWLQWTPEQFIRDLYGDHESVKRGFALDKGALDWADTCVLVLPCGRSAHLEAGYAAGKGKLTVFYLHPEKFEPELMYLLGDGCVTDHAALLKAINNGSGS